MGLHGPASTNTPAVLHPDARRANCVRGIAQDAGASGETNPASTESHRLAGLVPWYIQGMGRSEKPAAIPRLSPLGMSCLCKIRYDFNQKNLHSTFRIRLLLLSAFGKLLSISTPHRRERWT